MKLTRLCVYEFTSELEDNKQALPFLDLKLIRCNHKIKFEIHRKDTHSDNYIKFDSYNPEEHKLAAFNSLIYRMENLPLERDTKITEYNYIVETAKKNGVNLNTIEKLVSRHRRKKRIREVTTFKPNKEKESYRKFTYHPYLHNRFQKVFKKYNIRLAPKNNLSIKNLLNCDLKDKIPDMKRSGIYKVECENCNMGYIGKTKRNLEIRKKEHWRCIKNQSTEKSAIAFHFWEEGHNLKDPSLIKPLNRVKEQKIWEELLIYQNKDNLFNFDIPVKDKLFEETLRKSKVARKYTEEQSG